MGLIAKETSDVDRKLIEAGVHIGTCYMVVDIGTHHNEEFNKDAHKVVLGWEIPEQRADFTVDGERKNLPLVITKTFTVSLHKKAGLRLLLEAWRGKAFTEEELAGFDLKNVLGKSCQLQVLHKAGSTGQVYANLGSVMPLPKGMKAPDQETPSQWYSLSEDVDIPANIPNWLVEKIKASKEWHKSHHPCEQEVGTAAGTAAGKVATAFDGKTVEPTDELPF
jgi:hypothetical protein